MRKQGFWLLIAVAAAAVMAAGPGCARHPEFPTDVPVSGGRDILLPLEDQAIEGVFPRRSTLAGLLDAHDFDAAAARDVIGAAGTVFDPRRYRAGNPYRLVVAGDGALRLLEYHVDEDQFLQVRRDADGQTYRADLIAYEKHVAETRVRGFIDARNNSLVAALDAGGENVMLAIEMADVLAGEIDFNTELRRGDHFDVLFEKLYREGEFSGYGDVLAMQFVNDGREVHAFLFTVPGEDEPQYFDSRGRSLKRQFLRSPFNFEPRVTSRFSYNRLHPVLGVRRPHLGVDYGAPTGTPIIAVANGTVVSAGRSGQSGNMVRLRHKNNYETYYLHLSKFAPGVRTGARVRQGQVIGRVGSTGLSTGPHLDYRMRKNGDFVNPLLEHRRMPPGEPVPDEHLDAFQQVRDQALARLALEPSPAGETRTLAQ